jgi:Skp family chaperone for outer membrane proteins
MDAFENGVFYAPDTKEDVQDTLYMNAAGGKKAESNYDAQYRARYTAKTTPAGMQSTVKALQAELARVNGKRCPKETVGKAIFTGGLANIQARQCRREQEARANALSAIINEYQDRKTAMQAEAKAKEEEAKMAAAEAAAAATMAPEQYYPDMADTTTAGMVPTGGMNTTTLLLIGGGAVAAIVIAVIATRK